MNIRKDGLGVWVLIFSLLAPAFCFAQQTSITTNAIVEQLLRDAGGEQIVELSGYVGPSTPETIRLYQDLSLIRYLEIPRAEIIHSLQQGDPKFGPTKIYVRGTAKILVAKRQSASTFARLERLEEHPCTVVCDACEHGVHSACPSCDRCLSTYPPGR
jgi:hypothetical protein